ncbi:hypothetical protein JCM33774_24910 [Actinophytocola sp. KF-1]
MGGVLHVPFKTRGDADAWVGMRIDQALPAAGLGCAGWVGVLKGAFESFSGMSAPFRARAVA